MAAEPQKPTTTYAHQAALPCPRCQTEIQFDVYVIVDLDRRPDLLGRLLNGTLHVLECPNCHERGELAVPLLVYRRSSEPHLLFSPSPAGASEDQVTADIQRLVTLFRQSAHEEWRDEFVESGLPIVPRNLLVEALEPDVAPVSEVVPGAPTLVALPDTVTDQDVFALLNTLDGADAVTVSAAAAAWARVRDANLSGFPRELSTSIYLNGAQAAWLHYQAAHDPADLDRAISGWERLVAQTPEPAPVRAQRLNRLAAGFTARHNLTGELSAARRAADAAREAAVLMTGDPNQDARYARNRGAAAGDLGHALLERFKTTNEPADLNEAIACLAEALDALPVAARASELAGALGQRFAIVGDRGDLDEAIRRARWAARSADSKIDQGRALLTLGNLLCAVHDHDLREAGLDEAIGAYREAQTHFGENSADWILCRNNYATALRDRYSRYGDLEALNEAIRASEDVLPRSQDVSRRAMYLINLATQLLTRDERTASDEDLARAIQLLEEAVQLARPATLDAAASALNLALGLDRQYHRHGRPSDLAHAVEWYRSACRVAQSQQVSVMPDIVRSWARSALERRSWREAIEATTAGIDVFEQLYGANVLRRDRESWQRAVRGIVMMHAYALARDGQPESAAGALERAWGRQLADSLAPGRADLRSVERTDPQLVETYRAAAAGLRRLELEDRRPGSAWNDSTDPAASRDGRALLKDARAEFADAVARVHSRVAADSTGRSDLDAIAASLVDRQAIVYVFATPFGSLALVVSRGGPLAPQGAGPRVDTVWVDGFVLADLDRMLMRRDNGAVTGGYLPGRSGNVDWLRLALHDALPQLGDRLIAPVAARLREIGVSDVALVAGGMLSALPLGAATYGVNGTQMSLLDEFTVSNVPCARILAQARQSLATESGDTRSLLAVGNPLPLPDGFPALEGAEEEVTEIAGRFEGAVLRLCGKDATYANVTAALTSATHVHLACHGVFASANPMLSSLVLAEGQALTLGSMLFEADLRNVRLAVLSACETAVVDIENVPEEAVGFPAGFLQAGVAGVVASLWPVDDEATRRLMTRFYDFLFKGDGSGPMPPAVALRRAQQSLRPLRPDPIDWAAFAFYGAS